jgi:hypothetical protein
MWLIVSFMLLSIATVHTLVPIGGNMNFLLEFNRIQPYVNLVRQSAAWGNITAPWIPITTVDPRTGWPTSDFAVILSSGAIDLGGAYLIYAKGNANISIWDNRQAYITNQTYDPTTNTLTAVANLPENSTSFILVFENTTGPGLQDLAVLQPGYDLSAKSNFTKLFLTHLSRFTIVRFMQWTDTNHNPERFWNESTPVSWPSYAFPLHNPWETIPYMMNQIDKPVDAWVNIQFNASDDYILHIAQILFKDLNPRSNIYLEFSNEVWNGGFPQYHGNVAAANDSVVNQGDPHHFNYDNVSNTGIWAVRRTAYQIKYVADLFKTVFGAENVGPWKRVRPILAGQTDYLPVLANGLDYLNAIFGPPSSILHGIAIAPYFSIMPYDQWTNLTTDQIIDAWNSSVMSMMPESGWGYKEPIGMHALYAAWYKLPVYGYESGADTAGRCGLCSIEAKINAVRDPRLTDICVTYLEGWFRYGFEDINWYTAGASTTDRWGSFSLMEDMRQETLIDTTHMFNATSAVAQLSRPSPKLKAIDQVRESTIEMNFGISIPALNISAGNFMHHGYPIPPYVSYLPLNTTLYYPLLVHQSPIRVNITVYTSLNSSILEASMNNEQFVQVQTPKTTGRTVFEPTPVMQFNINQEKLPSIVTFRLKNLGTGYYIRSFDVVLSK